MRGAIIALVAAIALTGAAQAAAKQKGARVATATAPVALAPGGQQAATARCPKGTHLTGGGWVDSAPFTASPFSNLGDGSGLRITDLQSQPTGLVSWTAGAAAFTLPGSSGTYSAIARCESKSVGRTLLGASGSSTIPVSQSTTVDVNCPKGAHVLAGGFNLSPAGDLADPRSFRAHVNASHRVDPRTWEFFVVNPAGAPSDVFFAANVICEVNGKGLTPSERSAAAAIPDNGRATTTASCTGKTHTVGGGFLVTPGVGPAVGIDQMQPAGAKGWQVGLYEYPGFGLPPGSTITAFSYCHKNG